MGSGSAGEERAEFRHATGLHQHILNAPPRHSNSIVADWAVNATLRPSNAPPNNLKKETTTRT